MRTLLLRVLKDDGIPILLAHRLKFSFLVLLLYNFSVYTKIYEKLFVDN